MSQFSYASRVYMLENGIKFSVLRHEKYLTGGVGDYDVVMKVRNADNFRALELEYISHTFSRFRDVYGVYWSRVVNYFLSNKLKNKSRRVNSMVMVSDRTTFGLGGSRNFKHDELLKLLHGPPESYEECYVCHSMSHSVTRCSECGAGRCPICHRRFGHVCGSEIRPVVNICRSNETISFYFDDVYNLVELHTRSFSLFGADGEKLFEGQYGGRVRLDGSLDMSTTCRGVLSVDGCFGDWRGLIEGVYSLRVSMRVLGEVREECFIIRDVDDIPGYIDDVDGTLWMTLCPMPGYGTTWTVYRRGNGEFITIRGNAGFDLGEVMDRLMDAPIEDRFPVFDDMWEDDCYSDLGTVGSWSTVDGSEEEFCLLPDFGDTLYVD